MKKWQNKIGNHLEEARNTFLVQHPEAGWHEATPDISLLQQRCKLLKRSLERVTDLSSDSAGSVGKQNCSPGGTLLRPDKV